MTMARILERWITLFHPYSRNMTKRKSLIFILFFNGRVKGTWWNRGDFTFQFFFWSFFDQLKSTYKPKDKQIKSDLLLDYGILNVSFKNTDRWQSIFKCCFFSSFSIFSAQGRFTGIPNFPGVYLFFNLMYLQINSALYFNWVDSFSLLSLYFTFLFIFWFPSPIRSFFFHSFSTKFTIFFISFLYTYM